MYFSIEYENKIQSINKVRKNTTNYFKAHNEFATDCISLMEICFTHHSILNSLSEININSSHNLLTQHIRTKNIPSVKKEIVYIPYCSTTRWEFWVSKNTALQLIEVLRIAHNYHKNNSNYPSHETVMLPNIRQQIDLSAPTK